MLLKILFREYDYENGTQYNTISTTAGSAQVTANLNPAGGFNYHLIPVGARIEIEICQGVSKYIGNVQSVFNGSLLTLDRVVEETYENKIYWIDWTLFYLTVGTLSRKVESDDPGKAGLICFDGVDMSFFFGESISQAGITLGNPVLSAFAGPIDDKKRFIIRLQAVKWDFFEEEQKLITHTGDFLIDHLGNYLTANYRDFQSRTIFEGMVDFTTKQHPEARYDGVEELIHEVNFEVLDKLSALAIIARVQARTEGNILYDLNTDQNINRISIQTGAGDSEHKHHKWFKMGYRIFDGQAYSIEDTLLSSTPDAGSIIVSPFDGVSLSLVIYKGKKADEINDPQADVYLDVISLDSGYPHTSGNNKYVTNIRLWDKLFYNTNILMTEYVDNYPVYYLDAGNETEVQLQAGYKVTAFNAIELISAIVKQRWPDVNVINRLVDSAGNTLTEYPIPLNYFEDMIDELPLGKEPLDALTYLANGMMIYIFFDSNGNLVLQNKNRFQAENEKTIPADYMDAFTKKDFWDKLVDAITVKVYYWKTDLTGEGTIQKQNKAKPRNSKTFEVFVDSYWLEQFGMSAAANGDLVFPAHPEYTQQQIIDEYAYLLAEKQFAFYGKRHESLEFQLNKLDWNVIKWDLLNTFLYNNKKYFTTNINIDLIENTLQMEIPSEDGYNYNINNVLIRTSN